MMTDEPAAGSPEAQASQGSPGGGEQPGSQDTVAPAAPDTAAAPAGGGANDRICSFLDPVFGGLVGEAVKVSNLRALRLDDVQTLIAAAEDGDKRASPLLAQRLAAILQQLGSVEADDLNRLHGIVELITIASDQPADAATLDTGGITATLSGAWQRVDAHWTKLADAGHCQPKQSAPLTKLYERLIYCARRLVGNSEGEVKAKFRDALITPILRTVTNAALSVGNRRIASEALFDIFDMTAASESALKRVQNSLTDLGRSFASAGDFLCQGNLTEFVASLIRSDQIKLNEGGRAFCAGICPTKKEEVFEKFAVILNNESGGRMLELARPFIVFSNSVSQPRTVWSFETEIKILSKDEAKVPHITLGTVWLDCGREFITVISDSVQHEIEGIASGDKSNLAVCFPFSDIQEMKAAKATPHAVTFVRDQPVSGLTANPLLSAEHHRDISVKFRKEDAAHAMEVLNNGLAAEPESSPSSPEPPAVKNDAPPKPTASAKPKAPAPVTAPPKVQPSAVPKPKGKGKGKGKGKAAKGKRKGKAGDADGDDEHAQEPSPGAVVEPVQTAKASSGPAVSGAEKRAPKEEAAKPLLVLKKPSHAETPPPPNGILKSPVGKDAAPKPGAKRKLAEAQPPAAAVKPPEPAPSPAAPVAARSRPTRPKKAAAAASAPTVAAAPETQIEPDAVVPESPPEEPAAVDESEAKSGADGGEPAAKKQKRGGAQAAAASAKPVAKPPPNRAATKPKAKEPRNAKPVAQQELDAGSRDSDEEMSAVDDDDGGGDDEMRNLMAQVKRVSAIKLDRKKREYDKLANKSFAKIESLLKEQLAAMNADRESAQKRLEKEAAALKSEHSALINTTKAIAQSVAAQLQELERAEQELKKRAASMVAEAHAEPTDCAAKIKAAVGQCKELATRMRDTMFAVARDDQNAKVEKTLRMIL